MWWLWRRPGFPQCCRQTEWTYQTARDDSRPFVDLLANLITVTCRVRSLINAVRLTALSFVTWRISCWHMKNWRFRLCSLLFFYLCLSDEEIVSVRKKGEEVGVCACFVCVWVGDFFFFCPTCALSLMTTDLTRIGGPLWRTAHSLRCNILLRAWIQNKELTSLHYL